MARSDEERRYPSDDIRERMLRLFTRIQLALMNGLEREEGQAVTEYAMIIAFLAVLAISAARFLAGRFTSVLSTVASSI
jgi:Flp pilus assembly pilin Flp